MIDINKKIYINKYYTIMSFDNPSSNTSSEMPMSKKMYWINKLTPRVKLNKSEKISNNVSDDAFFDESIHVSKGPYLRESEKNSKKTLSRGSIGSTRMKTYLINCCGYKCSLPDSIKKNLPGYKCIKLLGEGAFGATFMMSHPTKESIAIKVLQDVRKKRSDNESNILKILSNSCSKRRVVCYHKSFSEGDVTYFVTEFVNGTIINKHLKKRNGDIYKVLAQLIDAVEYIHSKDIIHFDIKPDNIMVTKDGNVKLIDFGGASLKNKWGKVRSNASTLFFSPFLNFERARPFDLGIYNDWVSVIISSKYLVERSLNKIPEDLQYLTKIKKKELLPDNILSEVKKLKNVLDFYIESNSKSFLADGFKSNSRSILEKKMKSV